MKKEIEAYLAFISDKYLSIRPRSEQELRFYLQRKTNRRYVDYVELCEELVEEIINDFKKRNIINDVDFIMWWIGERLHFRPRGRRALESELIQKGVSTQTIKEYFEKTPFDEPSLIDRILNKQFSKTDLEDALARKKVIEYLLRKGFSYDNIKNKIEDFRKKK